MKILLALIMVLVIPSSCFADTFIDTFPCKAVAMYVRDECGAFSIHDEATQEKLDTIWLLGNFDGYGEVTSIEGIDHLHGLSMLRLSSHWQSEVSVSSIPPEIGKLSELFSIEIMNQPITILPDEIGNLTQVTILTITDCKELSSLPDSIGNLVNLTSLDLSGSGITHLPESIGNLVNLTYLDISNTKITQLPESIRNLTRLETFKRAGLSLE